MELQQEPLSNELERWLRSDGDMSLQGLIELFGEKSFAILFVLLLRVPALPLPTGGATHVFEIIAERFSRPRLRFLFNHRLSNIVFGALVVGGSVGAFVAPPFSGLDTLPALGVVVLSLGVLLEDALVIAVALLLIAAGVVLEVVLGEAAIKGLGSLL